MDKAIIDKCVYKKDGAEELLQDKAEQLHREMGVDINDMKEFLLRLSIWKSNGASVSKFEISAEMIEDSYSYAIPFIKKV